MRTLLIRHAETVWNAARKIQGQADPPLSARGLEQCERLRRRLGDVPMTRVYTSDLERARVTAEAAAAGQAELEPVHLEGLREVALGSWEGATSDSLARGWPEQYQAWLAKPSWDLVPEGEGSRAFADRVVATMSEILAGSGAGDVVAVVTHIGVIRLMLSMLTGAPTEDMRWRWAIDNTSITAIDSTPEFASWEAGHAEIRAINDNQHIQGMPR